jgi:poly(hydroxyalkanoate) depolymerase family esterase
MTHWIFKCEHKNKTAGPFRVMLAAMIRRPFLLRLAPLMGMLFVGGGAGAQLQEVTPPIENPGQLRMWMRAPMNGDTTQRRPLVVLLHGCTQDAEELVTISGWDKMADERGCYLLCPEQRTSNHIADCFHWFRHRDTDSISGEVGSIANMVRWALEEYPIDPECVFIYGVSAGGGMTSAVMAQYPWLFKAGAVLAGAPYLGDASAFNGLLAMVAPKDRGPAEWGDMVTGLHPGYQGEWPKVLVMHGTSDPIVDPRSSTELIDQWTAVHGTDAIADRTVNDMDGIEGLDRMAYQDGSGEEVVVFYRYEKIKHRLCICPGEGPCQGGVISHLSVATPFHSTCAVADWWGL